MMQFDIALGNRQPQTSTFAGTGIGAIGLIERFENMLQRFGLNADTRIFDRQLPTIGTEWGNLYTHFAVISELDGVPNEIFNDLLDLRRITLDECWCIGIELEFQFDFFVDG